MGPDATALGWVFQYALVHESGTNSLADIRSYQDWYLRYYLKSVPGVAEVAPVGGFGKQFQVDVDPHRLQAYDLPIRRVADAVAERQPRIRRTPDRVRGHGIHGARSRLPQVGGRH